VETAFVLAIACLFLFGIIEYGRYLFVLQVVENAAREGARHAVVHTHITTLDADTVAVVNQRMAGVQNVVRNYKVDVYRSDGTGNNGGLASDAAFGEYIVVEINADYDPILPNFLLMGSEIHIRTKAMMNSEAN
jgi:Flp pilus assembly protein TadG